MWWSNHLQFNERPITEMIETFAVENDFVQATTDFTLIRYYLLIVANVMLGSIHGSFSAHAHNHHPPHNIEQELELFLSVHDVKELRIWWSTDHWVLLFWVHNMIKSSLLPTSCLAVAVTWSRLPSPHIPHLHSITLDSGSDSLRLLCQLCHE